MWFADKSLTTSPSGTKALISKAFSICQFLGCKYSQSSHHVWSQATNLESLSAREGALKRVVYSGLSWETVSQSTSAPENPWPLLLSTHIRLQISWTGNWAVLCRPCSLVARGENSPLSLYCPGPFPSSVSLLPWSFPLQCIFTSKVLRCPVNSTSDNLAPTHLPTSF